jgi:hypothetical protein
MVRKPGDQRHWVWSPAYTAVFIALCVCFVVAVVLDQSGWQWLFAAALIVAGLGPPMRAVLVAFNGP